LVLSVVRFNRLRPAIGRRAVDFWHHGRSFPTIPSAPGLTRLRALVQMLTAGLGCRIWPMSLIRWDSVLDHLYQVSPQLILICKLRGRSRDRHVARSFCNGM